MIERFTREARDAVADAQAAALDCGHDRIDAPHLLLGLLRRQDGAGCRVLQACGLRHDELSGLVRDMYERGDRCRAPVPFGADAKTLFEIAVGEAARLRHTEIGTAHLALACSHAAELPSIAPFVAGRGPAIAEAALGAAARQERSADEPAHSRPSCNKSEST